MYCTTLVYILLLLYYVCVCVCTKSTPQRCEKYLKLVVGRNIQWTTPRKYVKRHVEEICNLKTKNLSVPCRFVFLTYTFWKLHFFSGYLHYRIYIYIYCSTYWLFYLNAVSVILSVWLAALYNTLLKTPVKRISVGSYGDNKICGFKRRGADGAPCRVQIIVLHTT